MNNASEFKVALLIGDSNSFHHVAGSLPIITSKNGKLPIIVTNEPNMMIGIIIKNESRITAKTVTELNLSASFIIGS